MIGQWLQPSLLLEYGIVGMLCEPISSQPIPEAEIDPVRWSVASSRPAERHCLQQARHLYKRFDDSWHLRPLPLLVSLRFTATIVTI